MGLLRKQTPKGLKIIIFGGGFLGRAILDELCDENHDITVVDNDEKKLQEIREKYDVFTVEGNCTSFTLQEEAGIKDADLIIAVTDNDERNLLCCTISKSMGKCSTIARVKSPDYTVDNNVLSSKLGIDLIINPERETAIEISKIVGTPNALEVNPIARGGADWIYFKIPNGNIMHDKTVAQLGSTISDILFCAVERDDEIYIPTGDFKFQSGDIVSFVASRKRIKPFFKTIGYKMGSVKSAMIIGGGNVAYYLANFLLEMNMDVKIIEENRERCDELNKLLSRATIIWGDGTSEEMLEESGIERVESFITLTGSDEENILLTLHAKNVTDANVVTKINRLTFHDVLDNLDLGAVVYPREITAETIAKYVREKNRVSDYDNIQSLHHLFDTRGEAIEFSVEKESEVTNVPLMSLKLKKNVLISLISRHGKIIFPTGRDVIKPGDLVMVVTTNKGFRNITDILM